MGKTHNLKTLQVFFSGLRSKQKTFEVRKNDRKFEEGDTLVLNEYIPLLNKYTGEVEKREVTYVLHGGDFGIQPGYCVLGLKEI